MNRTGIFALLCGASFAGLSISTTALAQSQTGQGAADIIVTAQRREENVLKVPVTVAVIGGGQLAQQNLVSTADLVQAVPALTVTEFGTFQVRSLGTQGFGKSAEQSVSVVVDGVPMPRPQAYELSNGLFDVERVEVLSGPQGTLFGKNASAGVINLVTKSPVLGDYQVAGHVDIGNHDVVNVNGMVNIPFGDTAALRVVGHYNAQGHMIYNTLFNKWDHSSDTGVRARLLWEPSDSFRVNLTGDYQHLRSNGVNGIAGFAGVSTFRSVPPGGPLEAVLASCGIVAGPKNTKTCGDSLYDPNVPDRGDVYGGRRRGASAQIEWDFAEGYTLTSISALRHDVTGDFDVEGEFSGGFGDTIPLNFLQRNLFPTSLKMFSQELRVQSPATDRINFVAGLYYSNIRGRDHIDQAGAFLIPLGGLEFRRVSDVHNRAINYAAFGQVNFDVTPELRLLAGGRITRDRLRTIAANSFPGQFPAGPFLYTGNAGFFSLYPINSCTVAGGNPDDPSTCPAGTSLTEPARISETGVTWKVGAQYNFTPQTMIYATFTKGYKGPFINDQASASQNGPPIPVGASLIVKSEKPDAYEIGLKTRLFNRINLSVALFNTKANGFQTTVFIPSEVSGQAVPSFFQGNTKYAITRGVDIGITGTLSENFSFNASLLYNEAHYNKGFQVPCAIEPDGSCEARRQLPFAPKWKGNISGEYHHDIGNRVEGFLQSDLSYSSSFPYTSTPTGLISGARYILGGRAGLRLDKDKLAVSVFCRNCMDKRYPVIVNPGTGFFLDSQQQFFSLSSFRVLGVTLDAKF